MKRNILFILILSNVLMSFSQKNIYYTRWSFTGHAGYSYFDGDINQYQYDLFPTSKQKVMWGASVEYAINPAWGLSLDYFYYPLRAATGKSPEIDIATDLTNYNLNGTVNFTKLIFPETRSKLHFSGTLGLGLATYNYDVTPAIDTISSTGGIAGSVPVSFFLEYNFTKSIALGLRACYTAYTKDNIEGVKHLNFAGVTNDYIASGTLFLRYKLNYVSRKHVRNISTRDYTPNPAMDLAMANAARLNKLDSAFQKLSNKVDLQGAKLDSLANALSNDGPDTDGDGVPDSRDQDSSTPANTPVNFWGKPIKFPDCLPPCPGTNNLNGNGAISGISLGDDIPAVYFDFDKINLDDEALITIRKVSAKMKADPTLMVEVRGYCDYIGNVPYNQRLSQHRSDVVKAEMIKVWGIPANRIIPNGKGKIIEPRDKYRPNRRCDFFFSR
jgi:outer membrane protein OmpA-like peptidoglycan-associated protein